jgi:hypothetical protein
MSMAKAVAKLQAQLDAQRRAVDVDHFDLTTRELVRMVEDKELERAPSYQRKFRWTEEDESRLIESLLLGLPVPSIFVATNKNGTWEVVDGLQRISTLVHFASGKKEVLKSINKHDALRLDKLEKLNEFNGLTLDELPAPLQLSFGKRSIRVTALSDKSDYHVRFDMFQRLNTGGVALSHQEVRACIFRGEFNELLADLAGSGPFQRLVKLQSRRVNDGTREELVLKFFAYLQKRQEFSGAVTAFLNDFMAAAAKSFDREKGRELFAAVIDALVGFCSGAFLRKGYGTTPLNQLEAVMVAAGELLSEKKKLQRPRAGWLNDGELVKYSTKGTNTAAALRKRIERARSLLQGAKPTVTTADDAVN